MLDNLINKIRLKEKNSFDSFILIIIVFSAVLIGLETDKYLYTKYKYIFHILDLTILAIFVVELFIKLYAEKKKPWRYFYDAWNVFDFLIIVISFLPYMLTGRNEEAHALIALRVFRLARSFRVFRVFRVITHLKPLQLIIETLIKSLPSMGFVALLLLILFYIYSIIGVFIFGQIDTSHFGNIGVSFITLFLCLTGNWTDIMDNIMSQGYFEYLFVPFYFISFYFVAGLIVLNLFVGIIVDQLSEVKIQKEIEEIREGFMDDLNEEQGQIMLELVAQVNEINKTIKNLQIVLNKNME